MLTRLINDDVTAALRQLISEGAMFDVIVTSPPYNLGKNYGTGVDDKKKPARYLDWADSWLRALRAVLRPGGSLFLNMGDSPSRPWGALEVLGVARGSWVLQNKICWVKSLAIPEANKGERTVGHFKPINSDRYLNDTFEFIFHLTHDGNVPLDRKAPGVGTQYTDVSNLTRWAGTAGKNMRCRGNVWFMSYETIQSSAKQRPHPAIFPVELAARCIALHGVTRAADILDPFCGIGSTGVAALRLGCRSFTGIDYVEDFIVEAADRMGREEEELALLESARSCE